MMGFRIDRILVASGFASTIGEARQWIIYDRIIKIKKNNKFERCVKNSTILKKSNQIAIKIDKNKKSYDKIKKIQSELNNNSDFRSWMEGNLMVIEIESYKPQDLSKDFKINMNSLLNKYSFSMGL